MENKSCENGEHMELTPNETSPCERPSVNGTNEQAAGLRGRPVPVNKNSETKEEGITDEEEDFKDIDRGWAWVVMLASFGSFVLQGGAMYAVGIIHSALLDKYEASVSLTSWAGALYVAQCSMAGLLRCIFVCCTVIFSCHMCLLLVTSARSLLTVYFVNTGNQTVI